MHSLWFGVSPVLSQIEQEDLQIITSCSEERGRANAAECGDHNYHSTVIQRRITVEQSLNRVE